jgi:hypothetical protein
VKKRYLLIGLPIILSCIIGVFYFIVFPFIVHLQIVEESRNYQFEALVSYDSKYTLQALKHEDENGFYASFFITLHDTDEKVFQSSDIYRTRDLKSIKWDNESHNVIVLSGDVGTIYYYFVDNTWIKSSNADIWWSVSRYSEITSKHYEETANGYRAIFYSKGELGIERIENWMASCEPSEEYYQFICSDPDSWDMFIYYSLENSSFGNNDLKFFVDGSKVNLFVTSNDIASTANDYILIRIQAPSRGVWPSSSALYLDGKKVEKHGEVNY